MRLGDAGSSLIQSFERCELTAYPDSGGVWSIGWGHTGDSVYEGLVWTQAQADMQFLLDTQLAVNAVNRDLDVALSQNQFDALVSFGYNVGTPAEAKSMLMADVNASRFADAAAQFGLWIHVKGVVNAGLVNRRAAERALFVA